MTYKATQKVIRIGDSLAVTIPAKDVQAANIKAGERVEISFKKIPEAQQADKLDVEYEAFKEQYGQTLKNLADR